MTDKEYKAKEKKINDFIAVNLLPSAGKLLGHSKELVYKNKFLNEELLSILQIEKEIKLKEIQAAQKKVELVNAERKLKDKNNTIDMQSVLECYLLILQNNEEALNSRVEDLKMKDAKLRQKEFVLNQICDKSGEEIEDKNSSVKNGKKSAKNWNNSMAIRNQNFYIEGKFII